MAIRIGVVGYGNLAKGVECAIKQSSDMELKAVFTRRETDSIKPLHNAVRVYHIDEAINHKDEIDVMILCGGSAKDLPEQSKKFAEHFNIVDSFDTHADIPKHLKEVGEVAEKNGKLAIISVGWDPGMFSLNRLYGEAILANSKCYTFWGKGVSQGHSDAIRRIEGVLDAKQYTIPVEEALDAVRSGLNPELSTRQKHTRECFVVLKEGANRAKIEEDIKTMPNYFADYDTKVHFISKQELDEKHSGIAHGGFVITAGKSGWNLERNSIIEYNLKLDSNPEFTSAVLLAYARAAYRLSREQVRGCKTVFDIAPAYLSPRSREEIIKDLL